MSTKLEGVLKDCYAILDQIQNPLLREASRAIFAPSAPKSPTPVDHAEAWTDIVNKHGLGNELGNQELRGLFEPDEQALAVLTEAINLAHQHVDARQISSDRLKQAIDEMSYASIRSFLLP